MRQWEKRVLRRVKSAGVLLAAGAVLVACTQPEGFPPRTRVGLMPEGFRVRPVVSAADAASYVDEYAKALGVDGVHAVRVLDIRGRYWVYVEELGSDRAAFALGVEPGGEIRLKRFPAMEPEMMWNQKYGHRARPDSATIVEEVTPTQAEQRLSRALTIDSSLRMGPASAYYGYFLFPLCRDSRLVGEAAVNSADGEVVWERLTVAPKEIWAANGVDATPCD